VAFTQDWLTSVTQTVCWSVIFFFSSAGSSSAYLTIAEVLYQSSSWLSPERTVSNLL
jgi:hypothetical protein